MSPELEAGGLEEISVCVTLIYRIFSLQKGMSFRVDNEEYEESIVVTRTREDFSISFDLDPNHLADLGRQCAPPLIRARSLMQAIGIVYQMIDVLRFEVGPSEIGPVRRAPV